MMQIKNKRTAYIVIGLIISLSLAVILVKTVDMGQVWDNVRRLSLPTIFLVMAIYLINLLTRTYRWKYLICQKHHIEMKITLKALIYGYMLNQLLPVKIGEVARAEYLVQKQSISRGFLLGTIAIERVFDLIVIVMFLGISVLFSNLIKSHVKSNIVPIVLILSGLIMIFATLYHISKFKRLSRYFPSKIENTLNHFIDNLTSSSQLFHSISKFIALFLLSLTIWCLTCASVYVLLNSLGIKLPFYAYLFIVSAGTFGMIIPSTSANVGVYHAIAMGSVMMFTIPKEAALSYAIVAHAFDFFPAIILGGVLFGYSSAIHLLRKFLVRGTANL